MLIRLAALVLDAWAIVRHPGTAIRRVWLSVPAELVARAVLAMCGIPRADARIVAGGGQGGPDVDTIVVEDARAAIYLDRVPIRPTAQTIGRYVLARGPLPESILRHELEHVRQWSALGPFFLPAYVLASAVAMVRGRDRYRDNTFEVAARAREGPVETRRPEDAAAASPETTFGGPA